MAHQGDVVERLVEYRRVVQARETERQLADVVDLGDELDLGRLLQGLRHLGERARRRRERLPDRRPRHQRIGVLHAAAGVELEPVVLHGLGLELRIVTREGSLDAGGELSDRLIRGGNIELIKLKPG